MKSFSCLPGYAVLCCAVADMVRRFTSREAGLRGKQGRTQRGEGTINSNRSQGFEKEGDFEEGNVSRRG